MRLRWPWTSVARLDDRDREIEWLRARVVELEGQIVRSARKRAGLPESTPPSRLDRKARDEPMPDRLARYIAGMTNDSMRREADRQAHLRYQRCGNWEKVMYDTLPREVTSAEAD